MGIEHAKFDMDNMDRGIMGGRTPFSCIRQIFHYISM